MKKLLGLLLLSSVLVGSSFAQDASAMQLYKAAKLARGSTEPKAAQHIRHRKRTRHGKHAQKVKAGRKIRHSVSKATPTTAP